MYEKSFVAYCFLGRLLIPEYFIDLPFEFYKATRFYSKKLGFILRKLFSLAFAQIAVYILYFIRDPSQND